MFSVVIAYSWDEYSSTYIFNNKETAKRFLRWKWNDLINTAKTNDERLQEDSCYCDDDNHYAYIMWADYDYLELTLTEVCEPDSKFLDSIYYDALEKFDSLNTDEDLKRESLTFTDYMELKTLLSAELNNVRNVNAFTIRENAANWLANNGYNVTKKDNGYQITFI